MKTIWPPELEPEFKAGAIPMQSGQFNHICPNCGGHRMLMAYVIKSGPYRDPNGGKVKWLDLPDGKSGWYLGELKAAPCPVCCSGQMQQYLEKNCNLNAKDRQVMLSSFHDAGIFAGKKEARRIAAELLALNTTPYGFVTFWGGYGVGKTHLLKALVNGFRSVGVVSQYYILSDLLSEIRERFGDDRGSMQVENALQSFRDVKALCLDEINQVNLTPWVLETINRLLDYRYNQRDSLLTVMALNANPDQLPSDFGYLISRMREGKICEVGGGDVREALAA